MPSIVFGNYTGEPFDPSHGVPLLPDWSLCAFEDGELATAYGAFPLVVRLNGARRTAAGVTFVGTLPQFRRRGHLQDHGATSSGATSSSGSRSPSCSRRLPPYERYGYAVCASAVRYTIDPKLINFAPSMPKPTGTWREGSKDELPVLQQVYDQYVEPRRPLRRAPIMWEGQTLGIGGAPGEPQPWGPSIVSIYEEGGVPARRPGDVALRHAALLVDGDDARAPRLRLARRAAGAERLALPDDGAHGAGGRCAA